MTRKTLVFGNGLGMALDPDHFSLSNAIQYVWDHPDILNDDERQYIEQCLPNAVVVKKGVAFFKTLFVGFAPPF